MPIPISFDIDRTMAEIHWLAEELGPRPYRGSAAQKAAIGFRKKLQELPKEDGWKVESVHEKDNIVACKGDGRRLFMAHLDTVKDSPGAIDNAAAAATLLEIAKTSEANNYCVAFPVGEEVGFIGSQQLAQFLAKWHPDPDVLDLVISLELTGHGNLWWSGLGKEWGDEQLKWLASNSDVPSQYAYQIVSRIYPGMERSDHRSFHGKGPLTAMLLGRNSDGIYPHYHQLTDTVSQVESEAILKLGGAINDILLAEKAPAPNPKTQRKAALMRRGWVVPSWAIWTLNTLGIAAGLTQISKYKETGLALVNGIMAMIAILGMTALLGETGILTPNFAELAAQAALNVPASGWWDAALIASPLSVVIFLGLRYWLKPSGSAALLATLLCVPMLFVDPLLATPMAIAALLGRLWGPLAIGGVWLWFTPSVLRELTFHGLLTPLTWIIPMSLMIPAMGLGFLQIKSRPPIQKEDPNG